MTHLWNGRNNKLAAQDPILRWAGGKRQLRAQLLQFCPRDTNKRRYIEPFLGAGSLFLALTPPSAVLADANRNLIETYQAVRDSPVDVANHLRRLASVHSPSAYYEVRQRYNRRPGPAHVQAARFIYLNRTCYNGIFRVNKRGEFNVPCGRIMHPWFPDAATLQQLGKTFAAATLLAGDYRDTLSIATRNDFVYLDPPYPPLNGTSYFSHYTRDRFDAKDQQSVASLFRDLDRGGCKVMLSNADIRTIRRLYSGFNIHSLPVNRWVTCKAEKHIVRELIVTNYDV